MKAEVVLCDVCKERVATGKCDVCGKDVCKQHLLVVKPHSTEYRDGLQLFFNFRAVESYSETSPWDKETVKNSVKICYDCYRLMTNLIEDSSLLKEWLKKLPEIAALRKL